MQSFPCNSGQRFVAFRPWCCLICSRYLNSRTPKRLTNIGQTAPRFWITLKTRKEPKISFRATCLWTHLESGCDIHETRLFYRRRGTKNQPSKGKKKKIHQLLLYHMTAACKRFAPTSSFRIWSNPSSTLPTNTTTSALFFHYDCAITVIGNLSSSFLLSFSKWKKNCPHKRSPQNRQECVPSPSLQLRRLVYFGKAVKGAFLIVFFPFIAILSACLSDCLMNGRTSGQPASQPA